MGDAEFVGSGQAVGNLHCDGNGFPHWNTAGSQEFSQRLSPTQLKYQKTPPLMVPKVMEGEDIGMREFGNCASFVFQSPALLRFLRDGFWQHLDGDRALESCVPGAVRFAHDTSSQRRQNFEWTKSFTQGESHQWRDYTPITTENRPA